MLFSAHFLYFAVALSLDATLYVYELVTLKLRLVSLEANYWYKENMYEYLTYISEVEYISMYR